MTFEVGGHALYLSVSIAFAAPYIVIDNVLASYYIHYFQTTVDATGYPRTDDAVGLEVAYKFDGTDGSIHFPDAALGQDDGVILDSSFGV